MDNFIKVLILTCIVLILSNPVRIASSQPNSVDLEQLPSIGKWMLNSEGTPANWLGQKYQDKELREPINIIIVDSKSVSPEEAKTHLVNGCARAGYEIRMGHSVGYMGSIDDTLYAQLPEQSNHAFSDHFFIFPNNHGRLFGPHYNNGKYYFIGSLSREGIDIFAKVQHVYRSFMIARDDFAKQLNERTEYHIAGKVDLKNSLPDDSIQTTGDHDGKAIVLVAE